jgi:hypothetical protein
MAAAARIMVDPMSRGMQYGMQANAHYEKAIALNPENPRPYLLKAQGTAYTPEQYGGGPLKAETQLLIALEKFKTDHAADSYLPHWGLNLAVKLQGWVESVKNPTPQPDTNESDN